MSTQTIVVAEDDVAIRDLLTHHLEREGFVVAATADGQAALRAARLGADLVVLDIGLPGLDGFDVARALRRDSALPILMLTARTDEIDRVIGFELGADDYVCKPFSPREVVGRVKAILRRSSQSFDPNPQLLAFGRVEIDESAREVRVDGCDAGLKPREFGLLLELAKNAGMALSRERLLQKVWGFDYDGDERTVDVHVRRIRMKIEGFKKVPPLITTVHGYGYNLQRAMK